MYFLKSALSGMSRRLVASILVVFGGSALLVAIVSIGLWSYWLGFEKQNLQSARSATVFVAGTENSAVEEVLTKVQQLSGVDSARMVAVEEFQGFLKEHFPDLSASVESLGTDVLPRTLEVNFPLGSDPFSHKKTVDELRAIPGVMRVDDGVVRMQKALSSLEWLSMGGALLAVGLWGVLLLVCLGHYQSILYTDAQEIQLIRSFGATKFEIFLPWLLEAVVQSLCTGVLCVICLFIGKNYLVDLYNQFFGVLGYQPFSLDWQRTFWIAAVVIGAAFTAHTLAGLAALVRGNIH